MFQFCRGCSFLQNSWQNQSEMYLHRKDYNCIWTADLYQSERCQGHRECNHLTMKNQIPFDRNLQHKDCSLLRTTVLTRTGTYLQHRSYSLQQRIDLNLSGMCQDRIGGSLKIRKYRFHFEMYQLHKVYKKPAKSGPNLTDMYLSGTDCTFLQIAGQTLSERSLLRIHYNLRALNLTEKCLHYTNYS